MCLTILFSISVVTVIPEAGKVPFLLERNVSPKFFKTGTRTSIFSQCVRVSVGVCACTHAYICVHVPDVTECSILAVGALSESKHLHQKSLPELPTYPRGRHVL